MLFNLRLDTETAERWEVAAFLEGMTVSELVRAAVNERGDRAIAAYSRIYGDPAADVALMRRRRERLAKLLGGRRARGELNARKHGDSDYRATA